MKDLSGNLESKDNSDYYNKTLSRITNKKQTGGNTQRVERSLETSKVMYLNQLKEIIDDLYRSKKKQGNQLF